MVCVSNDGSTENILNRLQKYANLEILSRADLTVKRPSMSHSS